VVSFAGDAIICVFLDKKEMRDNNELQQNNYDSETGLSSDGCYRALRCACLLRKHESKSLSTHIAISYGEMKIALLGGLNDQWVHVMNGLCVSELSSCIEDAGSQEVAVTPECYKQAVKACNHGSSIVTKAARGNSRNILILAIEGQRRHRPSSIGRIAVVETIGVGKIFNVLSNNMMKSVAQFVPKPILDAVFIESLDHIGELRQITTMFLSLDSYSSIENQDPTTLQPFFCNSSKDTS
jgi:hypothetical protein